MTFFAAIVAYGGEREWRGHHSVFLWRRLDEKLVASTKSIDYKCPMNAFFYEHYGKWVCRPTVRAGVLIVYCLYLAIAIYGCTLLRPNLSPSKLVVDDSPLRLAAYCLLSLSQVSAVLSVLTCLDNSSRHYLILLSSAHRFSYYYFCRHYIELAESHVWSEGLVGRVYVDSAPDFDINPNQTQAKIQRVMNFVMDLEKTKFSMGPNSTQIWLKAMIF